MRLLQLLGTAIAARASAGDGTVPGATLQALVDDAIARRAATLVVPAAEYDFTIAGGPSSLVVDSGAGLSIDGSGSTLWFRTGGGTLLTNCSRVELSAFTIDYTPTLAQGTIVSVQRNATPPSFVADFDARFLAPSQFELQWPRDDLIGVDHQPQRIVGSEPAVGQRGDQPTFGADVVAVHGPAEAQIKSRAAGMNLLLAQCHQPW